MRVVAKAVATILVVCAGSACNKGSDGGDKNNGSTGNAEKAVCAAAHTEACEESKTKLVELQEQREKALAEGKTDELAHISLQMNYYTERLQLLTADHPDAVLDAKLGELDSKYERLRTLLENDLTTHPSHNQAGGNQGDGRTPGSHIETNNSPFLYHPLELQAVSDVYKDFGELYIAESPKDQDGNVVMNELHVDQPWAGYWYPVNDDSLYKGDAAPLNKFDALLEKKGREAGAAADEKEMSGGLSGDSWEGRCNGWAFASVLTKEPQQSIEVEGITFDPSDIKALATMAFNRYPFKQFGLRFNGDASTDGTLQDTRPEAFHQIAMKMLGERKQAFIIDDTAGIEVWSKPVFRLRWSIVKDPDVKDAYLVKAYPEMTRERHEISDRPTSGLDSASPTYEYRLYVDPTIVRDGTFKVIAGEWINDSKNTHPDFIMLPEQGAELKSGNVVLDKNLDIVRQLVGVGG